MARSDVQLRKFDPFQIPGDVVRRLAVGRDAVLRELLSIVDENLGVGEAPPQPLCLVAPRGTGKTFLLRLLGLELNDQAAAGAKLLFLHLPEEMPHVLSPASFLREIRKRLRGEGPASNAPRKHDEYAAWHGLVADIDANLANRFGDGEGLLVLCVENIDDVLREAFPTENNQRDLRGWLERPRGRVMLIAASSTGPFDGESERALFGIVRNIPLASWTTEETMEFLGRVIQLRDGHALESKDAQVARAITSFTGGSPRMAVALAEVLGAEDALSAAQTLDSLIDNLQEYYLGRLRDMGREGKRCIGCLLTEGENASQTEVARRMGVQQSDVAQVFRKLVDDAFLIGDRLSNSKEKSYRVADRVFVHFYNVRVLYHGEARSVLAPILDFLVSAFTEEQRADQAERLLARGRRDDAAVLLGTLSVLDELTVDYRWWNGIRFLVRFAADYLAERLLDAGDYVADLRRLSHDRGLGAVISERYASRGSSDARPHLSALVAALGNLAAGMPVQARRWAAKIDGDDSPPSLVGVVLLTKAYIEYLVGDLDAQSQIAEELRRFAAAINDVELLALSISAESYIAFKRGDLKMAEALNVEASRLACPPNKQWIVAGSLRRLSDHASLLDQPQQAMTYARGSLKAAEQSGSAESIGRSKAQVAVCLLQERSSKEALALATDAAAIARERQDFDDYLNATSIIEIALRILDKPTEALELWREAVALVERHGSPYLRARAYSNLAWGLTLPASAGGNILFDEGRGFADRALELLGESPEFAWDRSLALEGRLSVAVAVSDCNESLLFAQQLVPAARQARRLDSMCWAWAETVRARLQLKQYRACVDDSNQALFELATINSSVDNNFRSIVHTLSKALQADDGLGELRSVHAGIVSRIDNFNYAARARLAGAFLQDAVRAGEYGWGIDLADDLLRNVKQDDATADRMDLVLACITGARAWERMSLQLNPSFWETAARQLAGMDVAQVLIKTEAMHGRPSSYAVFRGLWNAVRDATDEIGSRLTILRSVLTYHQINSLSAGLLTDIADTLADEGEGRFSAEIAVLREFARFNASGRDAAMLAKLNPDVATALRLADPMLAAPELAVSRTRKGGKSRSSHPRPLDSVNEPSIIRSKRGRLRIPKQCTTPDDTPGEP